MTTMKVSSICLAALAALAAVAIAIGGAWSLGGRVKPVHYDVQLVIPEEVELGEVAPGRWVPVRISLHNPTDRSITVLEPAPT
jgi:hypothetical protein